MADANFLKKLSDEEQEGFIQVFKNLALSLSDFISSEIRENYSMLEMAHQCETYQKLVETLPEPGIYYQVKWGEKYALLYISLDYLLILANRILGGPGEPEEREGGTLFFAEEILKDEIASWVVRYFGELNTPLLVERTEGDPKMFHIFYPEDAVFEAKYTCLMNGNPAGFMGICMSEELVTTWISTQQSTSAIQDILDS